MKQIDKETYKIKSFNRYSEKYEKKQIVLASSLRKSNYHITRLQHKEYGKTKKWNNYTISREGVIYEHFNPSLFSDFLGIRSTDKHIISIVLENMGSLIKTPTNKYVNSLGELCEEENVGVKNWVGKNYWETYPEIQIKKTIELCKYLCKKFDIQKKIIPFHYYHEKTNIFNGIVFRSNYIEETLDINPFMNIEDLNSMIK